MKTRIAATLLSTFCLLGACTTVPVDERAAVRQELNQTVDEALAALVSQDPEFQKAIDDSVGYFAAGVSATKAPIVGGGYGIGVLFDKENNSRTYLNITRFDVGAGLGAGRFRALILFENREIMGRFSRGTWSSGLGAESSAGTRSAGRYSSPGDGYSVHFSSEVSRL